MYDVYEAIGENVQVKEREEKYRLIEKLKLNYEKSVPHLLVSI